MLWVAACRDVVEARATVILNQPRHRKREGRCCPTLHLFPLSPTQVTLRSKWLRCAVSPFTDLGREVGVWEGAVAFAPRGHKGIRAKTFYAVPLHMLRAGLTATFSQGRGQLTGHDLPRGNWIATCTDRFSVSMYCSNSQ